MSNLSNFSRRSFVSGSTATITAVAASMHHRFSLAEEDAKKAGVGGAIQHSACKWCYKSIELEDLCVAGKEFGLQSIELLDPEHFPTLKKHGMHCGMVNYASAEMEVGG